jgi:hypothetical protein
MMDLVSISNKGKGMFPDVKIKRIIIAIVIIIINLFLVSGTVQAQEIRQPAAGGLFYPEDHLKLLEMIGDFLESVEARPPQGELVGFIVPHAGYLYSGKVAAYAYRLLENKQGKTIFILGPSHYVSFNGASVGNFRAYRTPLGEAKVDVEIVSRLLSYGRGIDFYPKAHKKEHSIEVQLPFLQAVVKDFSIVPVLIGDLSYETCSSVADAIVQASARRDAIFIASTDLSHYHPYQEAIRIDRKTIQAIQKMDPELLLKGIRNGEYELCGGAPVVTLLIILRNMKGVRAVPLYYANSGDTAGGDRSGVVGYAAIAFFK